MQTLSTLASLIGLNVMHGSPGYEELEVIHDVHFGNRVRISFESGFATNMTEAELEKFLEEGEVRYQQHFAGPHDTGLAVLKLAEYSTCYDENGIEIG